MYYTESMGKNYLRPYKTLLLSRILRSILWISRSHAMIWNIWILRFLPCNSWLLWATENICRWIYIHVCVQYICKGSTRVGLYTNSTPAYISLHCSLFLSYTSSCFVCVCVCVCVLRQWIYLLIKSCVCVCVCVSKAQILNCGKREKGFQCVSNSNADSHVFVTFLLCR